MSDYMCDICNKPIDDDKDDYETHDIYLKGEYEDTFVCHTDCRIRQEELVKKDDDSQEDYIHE